jgi:hypothetical protein
MQGIHLKCQYPATKLQDDLRVSVVFKNLSMCVLVFCVVSAVWSVWFHGFYSMDWSKLYFWAL